MREGREEERARREGEEEEGRKREQSGKEGEGYTRRWFEVAKKLKNWP